MTVAMMLLFCVSSMSASNPVVIGNARFTFYSSTLVRLEYALDAAFVNEPTLFAQNRSPQYDSVTVTRSGGEHYTLATPALRIEFYNDGFPFGQMNLRIYFKVAGREQMWYMASEQEGNLGGAVTTLDGVGSEIPLQEALLSLDGWYAVRDTGKEILKNGWLAPRPKNHIQDIYLFAYGRDFKGALKDLQRVSGAVPLTRKYVHGAWYCRWWNYTAQEYLDIARGYEQHNFPLDILVFDMGWHTQREAVTGCGHAGNRGWTGYTWNRELIPNPAALLHSLDSMGVKVVLNEHPHDGIRHHEEMYPAFMQAMGADTTGGRELLFDAGDSVYMHNFLHYAHRESEKMGVAFWWLDWQQDYLYPHVRGTGMTHLPWLNRLYYEASQRDSLRGMGFSRWGGWGDHRYPIQFSGDAVGNWEMLKFEVKLTATSGNAGCFFWAHDIGGFYDGNDAELYTRWTQFGLLNSSLRIHSVYDKKLDRRPWLWGKECEERLRKVYHWRACLMPYIYSSVWQCHRDMLPLNRAMYVEYPDSAASYHNEQQFLFGDLLLGAPVTSPVVNGVALQQVWLPGGERWFNLFTGRERRGGQTVTDSCSLDEFPLYVKGGYPLVMQPYRSHMCSGEIDTLVVRCYPGIEGHTGTYTLYEDDGLTTACDRGAYALTPLAFTQEGENGRLVIAPREGTYHGALTHRCYVAEFPATSSRARVQVKGGRGKATYDSKLQGWRVTVPSSSVASKVEITVKR